MASVWQSLGNQALADLRATVSDGSSQSVGRRVVVEERPAHTSGKRRRGGPMAEQRQRGALAAGRRTRGGHRGAAAAAGRELRLWHRRDGREASDSEHSVYRSTTPRPTRSQWPRWRSQSARGTAPATQRPRARRRERRSCDDAQGTRTPRVERRRRRLERPGATSTSSMTTTTKWRWRAQLTTIALSAARQERGGKIDDREREMSARDVIEGSDRIGSDRGIDSGRAPSYNS